MLEDGGGRTLAGDADQIDAHAPAARSAGVRPHPRMCETPESLPLATIHRTERMPEPVRAPGLDLDHDEIPSVVGDDVYLALWAPPVAVPDAVPALLEIARRSLFTFTTPVVLLRHALDGGEGACLR